MTFAGCPADPSFAFASAIGGCSSSALPLLGHSSSCGCCRAVAPTATDRRRAAFPCSLRVPKWAKPTTSQALGNTSEARSRAKEGGSWPRIIRQTWVRSPPGPLVVLPGDEGLWPRCVHHQPGARSSTLFSRGRYWGDALQLSHVLGGHERRRRVCLNSRDSVGRYRVGLVERHAHSTDDEEVSGRRGKGGMPARGRSPLSSTHGIPIRSGSWRNGLDVGGWPRVREAESGVQPFVAQLDSRSMPPIKEACRLSLVRSSPRPRLPRPAVAATCATSLVSRALTAGSSWSEFLSSRATRSACSCPT